jgi:hypothetical protein
MATMLCYCSLAFQITADLVAAPGTEEQVSTSFSRLAPPRQAGLPVCQVHALLLG